MSVYTILQKISRATDPTRFVESGKSGASVWSSSTRVVDEQFSFEKKAMNELGGHVVFERRAIASDFGKKESTVSLSIQREVQDGVDKWSVAMHDGDKKLVSREGDAAAMIALYKKLYASMTTDGNGKKVAKAVAGGVGALVAIYLALAAIGAMSSAGAAKTDMNQLSQGYYPQASALQQQQAVMQVQPQVQTSQGQPAEPNEPSSMLSDEEKRLIAKTANRIALGGTGAEILAFTDPHCPYCKRLEPEVEELVQKNEAKITLIPVAYKDGSREALAAVFCAKDQAVAWKKAIGGGDIGAKACDAGLKKVDENNKLFADLKLAATPSLVTPKGLIIASYANVDQLRSLLAH